MAPEMTPDPNPTPDKRKADSGKGRSGFSYSFDPAELTGSERIPDFMKRMTSGRFSTPYELTRLFFKGNGEKEEANIFADLYWSVLLNQGDVWRSLMAVEELKHSHFDKKFDGCKCFIVGYDSHSGYRRDLLILVPFHLPKPLLVPANLYELEQYYIPNLHRIYSRLRGLPEYENPREIKLFSIIERLLHQNDGEISFNGFNDEIKASIVVASLPQLEMHASVPDSALEVTDPSGGVLASTAGVIAYNGSDHGLTVAYHALRVGSTLGYAGQRVNVDGHAGTVISIDVVSDSAFVKLDDGVGHFPATPIASVRTKPAPGYGQAASFKRRGSHRVIDTKIVGSSPTLLMPHPSVQRQVLTNPDSLPGDSGSALVDDTGQLTGFCFGGSGTSSPLLFSLWIWADSVFDAHNLR